MLPGACYCLPAKEHCGHSLGLNSFSDSSDLTQLILPSVKEGRITSTAKVEENSNSTDGGRVVVTRGGRYLSKTENHPCTKVAKERPQGPGSGGAMESTPSRVVGQPGTTNAQNLPGWLQEHGQEPCGLSNGSCLSLKLKAELKLIKLS